MTDFTDFDDAEPSGALAEDLERETPEDASGEDEQGSGDSDEGDGDEQAAAPPKKKKRRRRRKTISPAHEERIARYRQLVEDRGWIFAPPSPPQPVSWLFDDLTPGQLESLAG